MAIESTSPEIAVLKARVEDAFRAPLKVHSDFVALGDDIFSRTRQHMSETTLERLWGYSTRGNPTVSRRSLDVLCIYAGYPGWDSFLLRLKEETGSESDLFDAETIASPSLEPGARVLIGWQPDRLCTVRYLGNNRFVAEETHNSRMQPGDTFSCLQFRLHSPLFLEDFTSVASGATAAAYGVGLHHGLTTLRLLTPHKPHLPDTD